MPLIGYLITEDVNNKPRKTQNKQQSWKIGKQSSSKRTDSQELQKGCLGGVEPLKLTTITTLSAVFPKAHRSQSEANKEAEIEALGTQSR